MEAMYPLLCNPDEHVLSTLGSLVLALLEGKTDLPISGVFGAGKTRSAAILMVGLLVFEPNLNLMVLTKENVAAQAFAEHIEGLNMPPCVNAKIGRLVGYMELKKNRTKGTSLDVTSENRHEVLKQKRLLIGCGGGFQQECSQSYSPVLQWIIEVALTLTDESQQFGNIEETSVIARTSRTCLNIWAGDHRQTLGGLKNTVECRLFRQKLLQRPLALRCGTNYIQPHEMYRIICRYLDGPWGSPSHQLKTLLEDADCPPRESRHMTAVTQLWCEIFGKEQVWLDTVVCATCFAILWMALKGEGVSSPVATSLDAAAGLAQRQKWGLILPSSARVSRLTYQTVIGVRYPELVRPTPTGWQYGRYVSEEATLQGGFLPVFWDVPKSTMHAVSDVGALVEWLQEHIVFGQDSADNLAVLHNQNHMVHEFGLSAWVTQSGRQVISRSVTSCAGMTAYMVVVAQTKVGFLTGGRGEKFRSLPEEERRTQEEEEEAYARATVALTRARKICVIFCPLDMKGLIGAATVMGSLMYGAGHCWNGMVNMHLRKSSVEECLSDNQFLSFLDHDDVPPDLTAQRRYPPVALIECVADLTQPHYKVRRLHLVIVDLWRPWKIHKSQVRSLTDQLRRLQPGPHADNTTPMMPMRSKTPLHGRRFVYGYSLDGSDFPCYLVWPWRTDSNSFFLLESQSRRYVALDEAGFLHPLGLRHFYDGFSLRAEISIRSAALVAFDLHEDELSNDLILSQAAVVDRGWADHQEQPVDQNAPEADRRNVPEEVISVSDGEVDRASTIGGCSSQASCSTTSSDEDSDTSEPAMSEVSVQHSMMEHAYQSLQDASL